MPQGTDYGRPERNAGSDFKDKATSEFERMSDQATDQFRRTTDAVEDVASRAAEQSRAAGRQVQEVAGNIKGAVDKSVKEQPMATLAVVAALGFVLGALWKS